ncbi:MAG TPA: ABC transporter ATP-binding protein, partial [Streptosporangiaceae bacterium]
MTGLGEIRAGDAGRAGGQRVPLLELDDLRTEIRLRASVVRALDGVSLQVQAGECLGIVGESGCGKTLTALSIMRLLPPGGHIAGGQVRLDGQEISSLAESGMRRIRGNEIGMIFQDPATSLNPMMTIGDQIAETVREHTGASRKAALRRATEVLGLVGMPRPAERVTYYPHQLSGGMRQRVMIAMALACEPRLLIADEPTTALDVTIQKQILELVDDLRRQLGMAMILITHDLGVISGRTDRVAVMYAGKVAETASTLRLFANPRHPYTQALFEALPERAGASRRLASIPGMPPDLADPPPGCRFAPRCRYAQEHCVQSDPGLDFEVPDHAYRCLFPVGTQERAVRNAELTVTEVGAADPAQALASDDGGRVLLRADQLMKTYPV